MLTRRELFERAYGKNFETAEAHNSTFSGSAAVCVASHAALDLLTDELLVRVRELGVNFRRGLTRSTLRPAALRRDPRRRADRGYRS